MTLSLETINNLPECAPLGHETKFNRRLFKDNFNRCCTIREFQKTVLTIVRAKVLPTPTSRIITERWINIALRWSNMFPIPPWKRNDNDLYHMKIKYGLRRYFRHFEGRNTPRIYSLKDYEVKHPPAAVLNKKGYIVKTRQNRLNRWAFYWRIYLERNLYVPNYIMKDANVEQLIADRLLQIGLPKFLESRDLTKKPPNYETNDMFKSFIRAYDAKKWLW